MSFRRKAQRAARRTTRELFTVATIEDANTGKTERRITMRRQPSHRPTRQQRTRFLSGNYEVRWPTMVDLPGFVTEMTP